MTPATVRLTVGQAIVRFLGRPAHRARRRRSTGSSPAASASSATATSPGSARPCCRPSSTSLGRCPTTRAATNRPWCTSRSATRARSATGCRRSPCTTSVGPGATNMVTGAALATVNRLPVLLLPGDVFATRVATRCCRSWRIRTAYDVSVNDAFRPVSRFFDRVWRPEQLPAALLGAMRVLTDPAETGAVTIALPRGRAGRGVRLAGRAVRGAGLADRPAGAGAGRADRGGRRADPGARSGR